jgi:RNA exonuclease 4
VAICNYRGATLLECYVVPTMAVTDYRTSTTGITSAHLSSRKSITDTETYLFPAPTRRPCKAPARKFDEVQCLVAEIIKDKVIVGHSLWNDLSGRPCFREPSPARVTVASIILVLGIPHPAVNTRDVALYQPFRNALRSPNQLVRLPTLTFHLMGRRCQEGQQNPVRCYYFPLEC